jgi:hypothetical protein
VLDLVRRIRALLMRRTTAARVGRVEALVGVGLSGEVAVGGDLPPREVDGLQARTYLLHGLAAGVGAERADVVLGVQQVPEVLAPRRARVFSSRTDPRRRMTSSAV